MKERVDSKKKPSDINEYAECTAAIKWDYYIGKHKDTVNKNFQFSGSCKDVLDELTNSEYFRKRDHQDNSSGIYVRELTVSSSLDIKWPSSSGVIERRYNSFFKAGTKFGDAQSAISYEKAIDAIEQEMTRLNF